MTATIAVTVKAAVIVMELAMLAAPMVTNLAVAARVAMIVRIVRRVSAEIVRSSAKAMLVPVGSARLVMVVRREAKVARPVMAAPLAAKVVRPVMAARRAPHKAVLPICLGHMKQIRWNVSA